MTRARQLVGRVHVVSRRLIVWPIGFDTVDFEAAITWFLGRVPLTKTEWLTLEEKARRKAFTVAGVAQLDLVAEVWSAIDKAIADGTTLADFKRDVGAKLEGAWNGTVASPPHRLETIFRTNVQMAHSAGRYREMT